MGKGQVGRLYRKKKPIGLHAKEAERKRLFKKIWFKWKKHHWMMARVNGRPFRYTDVSDSIRESGTKISSPIWKLQRENRWCDEMLARTIDMYRFSNQPSDA